MAPAPTPAPLSVGLLCVYKQYKADTETIASWLKANAVKHGYKFDGLDGVIIRTSDFIPSEFIRPFRFLSSARPSAFSTLAAITQRSRWSSSPKENHYAQASCGQMLPFGKEPYSILTANLLAPVVAQQIVADVKQSKFTLHPPIHRAFRRAIVSRRDCTAWYEENAENQWKSNVKHACTFRFYLGAPRKGSNHHKADSRADFTNILITAWDILLSAEADSSKPESVPLQRIRKGNISKTQSAVAEPKIDVSSNRFAAVYIDHGGDDDDDQLDVADREGFKSTGMPKKGKTSKSSYAAPPTTIIPDEDQVEEEFWFAIQSFLQEQQKVREEVRRYWKDFNGDESHLIMATFGTRMAIDLIRRSEIELGLTVNRPARFPEDRYPVSTFPALLVGTKQHDKQLSDAALDEFVLVSSRLNELTLYNTYSTLKTWCAFLRDDSTFKVNKTLLSNHEVSRLMEKISWVSSIAHKRLPYEDDITRGVKKALQCGEIPIWTVFSMRLLLDMEDVLYHNPLLPWKDASRHTLKHAHTPLTHWHHQAGCRHTPISEEPLDDSFPNERLVTRKLSLANTPMSMLEKVRFLEGPRKKGMAKKRPTKKKLSKSIKADEETGPCTCDACLRCGYDWYENDVERALKWTTDVEQGLVRFSTLPFETVRTNPLHCGLMKYNLYRSRQV